MYCRYSTGEERERQNDYDGWTYRLNLDLKWEWWFEIDARWCLAYYMAPSDKDIIVAYIDTWAEPFGGMED